MKKAILTLLFFIPLGISQAENPLPSQTISISLPIIDPESRNQIFEWMAMGDYQSVIKLLQKKLETITHPEKKALYAFWMGYLAFKDQKFGEALYFFSQANRENSPLKKYTHFFLGTTLNNQKAYGEALNFLNPDITSDRIIDLEIFWARMETLMGLSLWDEINALLTQWEKKLLASPVDTVKMKYFLSKISFKKGEPLEAIKQWKSLLTEHAGNFYELDIFEEIRKANIDVDEVLTDDDWLKRAEVLIENGLPLRALNIYKRLSQTKKLELEIANATFKARLYSQAAELYQKLWDHEKPGQDRSFIIDRLSTSYARSDQFEEAIKYNKKKLKQFKGTQVGNLASFKLAFLYFDSEDYKKAQKAYDELISSTYSPKQKKYRWVRSWSSYLLKDYEKTLKDLKILEQNEKNSDEKRKFQYWQARCLEKLGKWGEARDIYQAIGQKGFTSYYANLAFQRSQYKKLKPNILVDIYPNEQPETQNTQNQIYLLANQIPQTDPLFTAMLLGEMGLSLYAFDESNSNESKETNPKILLAGYNVSQNFIKISDEKWQMAYPLAYQSWVEHFSNIHSIDPFLALSMMRQESAFRPTIMSPSLAMGLMQIIPQTALDIAKELRIRFFHAEDLKDPITNIQFGTWYLKKLLDEFNGHFIYAIASYNAGPDAVTRWKKWGDGLELDELIELIPYKETNEYVKRVLVNYWNYKRLYGE